MIFLHIYVHLQSSFHWQFLPVSSNRSSKDSDPPSADQDQPCFICYFVLLIIPYMIFQQDLGNILIFLAVPVFFYLFQKETNLMLPASLFVMLTACCLGSLSYVIYHAFGVIFHPHGQSTEFYPESMIAQLIFLVFADIILYKPARKYLGWMVTNFHNAFVWRIACIFPCCFTFLVFTYIPHNYYDIYTYHDLHVYFP